MRRFNRSHVLQLLWVIAGAALAGSAAETLLVGTDYLSVPAMLLFSAACIALSWAYARALRLPTPQRATDLRLSTESLVSNRSYELRISRKDTEQIIRIEAQLGFRTVVLAICPVGFLSVGPAAVIWATVVEPSPHWALYPLIAALIAFLVWLGIAHVAMYLQQGYWGTSRLQLDGEWVSQQITWCGRVWLDRSYRISPAADVRSDFSSWFGVMIRGLELKPPWPWWKWLLLMGRADRISFGAALAPADAQLVAASLQRHFQAIREHFPAESLLSGAGI